MMQGWRGLLALYDLSGGISGCLSSTEALQILKEMRISHLRRPDVVLNLGTQVEDKCEETELWLLREQMFIAALDMKLEKRADEYLQKLMRQFPDSARVSRLVGIMFEAKGDYDGAMTVYDRLLAENPANISILQRTAATYKAQGNFPEALIELNKILELNNADPAVWAEVAEINIRINNYSEAAFCLEELILLDPYNHIVHTKLAELYYTLGGVKNFLKARRHYTSSLNILKGTLNQRALYGLMLACQNIHEASLTKGDVAISAEEQSVNAALLDFAKDELKEVVDKSIPSSFIYKGILGSKV